MKWNKEIFAILTSLLLLAALVVNWGYNVYQNKVTALKAESNIIFFEALETAKEQMFLKKTIRPRLVSGGNDNTIWETNRTSHLFELDSLVVRNTPRDFAHDPETCTEPLCDHEGWLFPQNLIQKELLAFTDSNDSISLRLNADEAVQVLFQNIFQDATDTLSNRGKVSNLSVRMTDDGGEIHMRQDTIIIVDFDTTQIYLERIFLEKMDTANLQQLKIKVYEAEDLDSQEIPVFTTNPGKVGDLFFGRKSYAATIQNFGPLALRKMIPEMLFGIFLYGLIAAAFLIIYRNLMAQKKLVRIKDEFVGNITHELKTPISVVNVAIEAIQNFDADKDPIKTKRYLDISKKELKRLSGLVDKVLHLTVNPSDEAPNEKVDIIELTAQVVDSMRVRLVDSPISIQFQAPENSLWLEANISQIKSVIYNLIDNAVKYSDQGNILIVIQELKNGLMEIKVSDQGIGIPASYQDKIFDQFFRVPSDNVHNVKGYGLGLHNVKQIVEQYGGSITLKSEEGVGTAFTIKWPMTNG